MLHDRRRFGVSAGMWFWWVFSRSRFPGGYLGSDEISVCLWIWFNFSLIPHHASGLLSGASSRRWRDSSFQGLKRFLRPSLILDPWSLIVDPWSKLSEDCRKFGKFWEILVKIPEMIEKFNRKIQYFTSVLNSRSLRVAIQRPTDRTGWVGTSRATASFSSATR